MKNRRAFIALAFFFLTVARADEKDLPRPEVYPTDEQWLLRSTRKLEAKLEAIPDESLTIDSLTTHLAPVIVGDMLTYCVQKDRIRAAIKTRLGQEETKPRPNAEAVAYFKRHLLLHERQIAYLSQQLRTRYGFSRLWNSKLSDSANLNALSQTFRLIVANSAVSAPKDNKFYLSGELFAKLRGSLADRLAKKFSNYPEQSRPWAFKDDTIGKASMLGFFVWALGGKLEEYNASKYPATP